MGLADYDPASLLKVLLVGSKDVEKRELLLRLAEHNTGEEPSINQISIDFRAISIILDNGKVLKLRLWYIPEVEKLKSLTRVHFKDARVILLCLDVTSLSTCEDIATLHDYCQEHASKYTSYIIVGDVSKIGRKNTQGEIIKRCFTVEDGQALAERLNAEAYCEVSSITGEGSKEILMTIAKLGLKLSETLSTIETEDVQTAQMAIDKAVNGSNGIGSFPPLKPIAKYAKIDKDLHDKLMEVLLKAINWQNYINGKFTVEHQALLAYHLAKALQTFLSYESSWLGFFKKLIFKNTEEDITKNLLLKTSIYTAIEDYLILVNNPQNLSYK